MSGSVLGDAFEHHMWATLRLVDGCLALSPEQLATVVPGTYGSILETVRHLVEGDGFYLFAMTGVARGPRRPARPDRSRFRSCLVD